jgi:hypothetical protein
MRAWEYSPRADVFALGTSCKNCNWYPYLVFIEREGTHIILGETWDAKVHSRGWRINSKRFWRWRTAFGFTAFQWPGLVSSNGPKCVGAWEWKHIQLPKCYVFWEQQTTEEVQKLNIPQKANEFVIWLNRAGHNRDWISIMFMGHQFGILSAKHDQENSKSLHYMAC